MPSGFLQAIGMGGHRSEEEREARGRAVRTSRHSSRVTVSRHRSTKLRAKERNKSSRSLMSATTGSESERKSRKRSSIRSNSGKKRTKQRDESKERKERRRSRKDGKRREEDLTGETGVTDVNEDGETVPSTADEEATPAGLGINALCDIPQQQAVDVFQFQSDWSDDEDADRRTLKQSEFELNIPGQYQDHPAEYESATDGHETDHPHEDEPSTDDFHLQEHHSDAEHLPLDEVDTSISTTPDDTEPQTQLELPVPAHRSFAASVTEETDDVPTPMPKDFAFSSPMRTVSSGSSFVSTQFSEPHDDAETERSTSPETSFKSPSPLHALLPESHETPTQPSKDEEGQAGQETSAAKVASQTLAAEHRQRTLRRRSSHHSRRPELPRHYPSHQQGQPYQNPWIPNPPYTNIQLQPIPPYNPDHQLSHIPGYPPAPPQMGMQMSPHTSHSAELPRDLAGNPPPATGYAALASALSPPPARASSSHNPANQVFQPTHTLPPLYRRFTTLNHRLLLHLQDELMELEEELVYLDGLDTASRTHPSSAPGRLVIRPGSRREGVMGGSEVEWRKAEALGRIGVKLGVYNEMLASFQRTEGMKRVGEEEVERYREYLSTKRPLVEAESAFIDHAEDLISLAPKRIQHRGHDEEDAVRSRARPQRRLIATAHSTMHEKDDERTREHTQTLSLAALLSVLVPILVFHVIPNFTGRMVVALIIALGVLIMVHLDGATAALDLGRGGKRVLGGAWGLSMVVLALIV